MNLYPLAQRLHGLGIGTMGQTLFIRSMPATVTTGILLLSDLSGTQLDYELPGFKRTGFQVIVRHTDYAQGVALMGQVTAALTLLKTTVGDFYVHWIRPKHEAVVFPTSEGDLLEISVNFEAVYYE